ncbi:pentatricopeptide repeat-containing protein 1, mitochondrial [Colias croceus]|uniref:pentatricopeptide repeat-containing protein 1, mitochondrial n=1 Tax=Colias crocea TaxID=72248 RepID=UPI001E27D5C3|nr:pentatricopeptide repeat-containing protein 1, mitochondrial [Colias croceus]
MASRCFHLIKNITQRHTYSMNLVRHNFSSVNIPAVNFTAQQKKGKEYKTENNLTYLEDPDTFGTLSSLPSANNNVFEDKGDIQEEDFLKNRPLKSRQLTIKQYADIIKQYLKHKRLKEALDILEVRMLKEDLVKPGNYIYNILIGACADVGYTKKAFKLYNDMKKRALKPTGDTYTCLFEACINSPYKENGLKHAKHLRNLMIEKGIEPNLTNYNVMVKTFGRCGDLPMAFKIVDEMISKGIKIRVHTLNHLLHACISDKDSGLRHALIVWRKMLKLREKPNIYSFNLMLKCVKECNLGSKEDIQEMICIIQENILLNDNKLKKNLYLEESKDMKFLPQHTSTNGGSKIHLPEENKDSNTNIHLPEENKDSNTNNSLLEIQTEDNITTKDLTIQTDDKVSLTFVDNKNLPSIPQQIVPNLLSKTLNLEQVCDLQEVHTVQDKFAILGGQDDFLQQMATYSVTPNIKTFTQILDVIEDNTEAEIKLIETMKSKNIKMDIAFFNMLIKKRCLRSDYKSAFDVKDMIENEAARIKKHPFNKKLKLKANIMTYGTLAMACNTKELAEKLLNEMKEKQLKVNITILGTLLRHGTTQMQFGYILYILEMVKQENLKVNDIFLRHLESFNEKCEKIIEKYKEDQKDSVLILAFNRYIMIYNKWLRNVNIEDVTKPEDPWQQFKESYPKPIQNENIDIVEPKRFYKRSRKYVPYTPKV